MNSLTLDLRGVKISLDRSELMELSESVLLCLFPNGVVLSPQRDPNVLLQDGQLPEEDVYYVDVSTTPRCSGQSFRGGVVCFQQGGF